MKLGELGHRQHGRATARSSTEQRGLKPVIVPLRPKRPRDLGSFGPLQILMCGAEANRATAGDLPQPQANFLRQEARMSAISRREFFKNAATNAVVAGFLSASARELRGRSEERRVGKECRSRWSPYH